MLASAPVRIESALPAAASARPRSSPRGDDCASDPVELLLLGAFAAMSVWVVALDVWEMIAHNLVWTGTDGFFIVDQMQYLAWIESASHHLLITNLFVLRPTPSDYFQPAIVISGAIAALGVAAVAGAAAVEAGRGAGHVPRDPRLRLPDRRWPRGSAAR